MVFKQIFIINSDLKMSAGKIAVQTAHGATYYMQHVCDKIVGLRGERKPPVSTVGIANPLV